MKTKTLLLLACFSLFTLHSSLLRSQSWISMMKDQNANVHDVQKAFYTWYSQQPTENSRQSEVGSQKSEETEGNYVQFKRWESMMEPRTWPSGKRPAPGS